MTDKEILKLIPEYSPENKQKTLVLGKDTQKIYFYGAMHSYDPKHKQFQEIKNLWSKFISEAPKAKRVLLIEGGIREVKNTEEDAIKSNSEAGFATFLANRNEVPIFSPEPNIIEEMGDLEEKYEKDIIQYYRFARVVNQWNYTQKEITFEEYIEPYLQWDKKGLKKYWQGYDFSLNHMKEIHKKLFGGDFCPDDEEFFYAITKPVYPNTIINKYDIESGRIRELHIVKQIKKHWDEGKSIFIVYGNNHVYVQEKVLREMLK